MIWGILLVIGIVALYLWITYNNLVALRLRVSEGFSQVDVQLKRRTDLIPNLVETVKGYAAHENDLLEKITKARSSLMTATGVSEKASANSELQRALKTLFAVSENYPNLKASTNFLNLQEELSDTESKIAYARQFYNSVVMGYNTKLQTFPSILIATTFNFQPRDFFAIEEGERSPAKVQF